MSRSDTGAATAPTMAIAVPSLAPRSTFADRYEVLDVLGEGGMGAVFRVLDRELGEQVALKTLRPEIAEVPGALDRFRREVRLARRVTHRNVARTYDLGIFAGVRFLTMEFIEGDTLTRRQGGDRKLPLGEALRVVGEVARGLAAAHAAGVVHRDLKPDNILLAGDRVVITDFGIARANADAAMEGAGTHAGQVLGTPAYMAPEQVQGREVDGRADVFALGVVLYELLTGRLPFEGETVYALAMARITGDARDPRALEPSLPRDAAELALQMLARKREQRPEAQAVLNRIEVLRGNVEPVDRAPRMTQIAPLAIAPVSASATGARARTLAVAPFAAPDGPAASIARSLSAALAQAVTSLRGAQVLSPGSVNAAAAAHVHGGVLDSAALGRALEADLVVEGSVRTAGARVRVRAAIVQVATGMQAWAERFDGQDDDPFSLEDAVVQRVSDALRARVQTGSGGPSDPEIRDLYRRARALHDRYAIGPLREAIALLRKAQEKAQDDPYVMSALGAALTRVWMLTGAVQRELIVEAEELTLRALNAAPEMGETYDTIGILRLNQGEMRAAARAFQEAAMRAPLLAEAHEYLGRLLCECGHTDEGMRRLELALRLDPNLVAAQWERARTFALLGDRRAAEQALERANAAGKSALAAFRQARLALWWNDALVVLKLADELAALTEPDMTFSRARLVPILRSLAVGGTPEEDLPELVRVAAQSSSPRQRAFLHQLAVEFLSIAGMHDAALDALEALVQQVFIDVLWLERAPPLSPLRDDPRFAKVLAVTASRAAEMWS